MSKPSREDYRKKATGLGPADEVAMMFDIQTEWLAEQINILKKEISDVKRNTRKKKSNNDKKKTK